MDWPFLLETALKLGRGVPVTLLLVACTLVLSGFLGLGLALAAYGESNLAKKAVTVYLLLFRGTPMLVQLFIVYYGLGQFEAVRTSFLWPMLREPFWCAILAFSLCQAAYSCEVFRGGLLTVSRGEIEAARAVGMARGLMLRRIILPLALRRAVPAYSNEMILIVKATSLGSTITLLEITGVASAEAASSYRIYEVLGLAGLTYLLLNGIITLGMRQLERAVSVHLKKSTHGGAF
jgi:octopine/nopaline transport system permease protein